MAFFEKIYSKKNMDKISIGFFEGNKNEMENSEWRMRATKPYWTMKNLKKQIRVTVVLFSPWCNKNAVDVILFIFMMLFMR